MKPVVLEDTYLPAQAVDIILEANKDIADEQKQYLMEHSVILSKISQDSIDEEAKEQKFYFNLFGT